MIFHGNIIPYFCRKLGKMTQNLSSAAVGIGVLRVKGALTKDAEQLPQRTRINPSAAHHD